MPFPSRDLTNQYISSSYQSVVQTYTQGTASYLLDGLGNVILFLPTSSVGQEVLTADQIIPFAVSSSYALESTFCDSASLAVYSSYAGSASYALTSATSSYALTATTASYAFTSSYEIQNVISTSFASSSISASYALTASSLIGWNFTNTSSVVNILSTNIPVIDISTGSYKAAFFDYVAFSGSNSRAGIVFGSWVNGIINYTEVSNIDIGDTSTVTMSMGLNGGDVQLIANVVNTTPWNITAVGRYL